MTVLFYLLIAFLLFGGVAWLFISTPAARLASLVSKVVPAFLIGAGALLTLVGRGGIGIPMAAIGLAVWRSMRPVGGLSSSGTSSKSTVRSAALEMELDHESGDMDGRILIGDREGTWLSAMDERALLRLYREISSDSESAALLEAYLDRRMPRWREDTEPNSGGGQGHSPASGSMTKEEAYQVLGLEPGASPAEIRNAWRKLMKSMHPDSGGSEFLAAKINAAKDILLD